MSAPSNSAGRSWLSNESYPASDASGPEEADSSHRPPELPTPAERIRDVLETYPERAMRPLSETHGRKLRADCLEEAETVEREIETGEHETATVSDTVSRSAEPWIGGLARLLEKHESYRDKKLKLARGTETRGDYESFLVDMDMSYSQEAAGRQYAQLQALERQFTGGEYPDGSECEGEFAEPVTVLLSLSASSLEAGEYRPPVDHDRAIREAWSGSTNSVKRVLRDVLERKCGLSPGDYAWHHQSEPHAGGGDASGYSHSHPFVVFDMAEADGEADPADPETYRAVVAKHVAECDGAEWEAHGLEEAVSVNAPEEIDELASYLSKYLAVGPDQDLLERSPEYLMYAASQFAASTQKYSRSRWATAAIKADKCQQQYLSGESDQTAEHGESVVRSSRPGLEFECAECGSPHGIDQSADSLARFRLNQAKTAATAATATRAVTDGGVGAGGHETAESGRTLAERWPSARAAGAVGSETRARECGHEEPDTCPLCATETVAPEHTVSASVPIPETAEAAPASRRSEGFDRPPEWEPEAVVQTASGEETEIGSPGGVEYGTVAVQGAESITERSPLPYLPPPSLLEGPEPWTGTELFTEADVREGRVPPPELVARETVEATRTGRRVTRKEWSPDWYTRRFGEAGGGESAGDCEPQLASEARRSIVELVRTEGVTSIPSVLGRLGIDPEKREAVADVLEECR